MARRKSELRKRLWAVFTHGAEPQWRYVPRSYNGGTGWGIFDRKLDRFVDEDLMNIPLDNLANELITTQ